MAQKKFDLKEIATREVNPFLGYGIIGAAFAIVLIIGLIVAL